MAFEGLAEKILGKRVAIYTRSSKDLHNVSCKAQEAEIKSKLGKYEEVYQVFTDEALSSTRNIRPAFDEMIMLATSKEPPFSKIYCLDTSRFGRSQHETQVVLWTLRRKHGIEVVFINMPNTGTYLDPVFETIMTAFDEIHSQQSKAKGLASMKQNIINGYRAGGRAPYGYRRLEIEQGAIRNGKPVVKVKLEPDPETASTAREFFERRAKHESRGSIFRDFYRRGIPSPSGRKEWSQSTGKAMEDNLDVYLGHTVFNRLNEQLKEGGRPAGYVQSKKYKEMDEWVRCDNTHNPVITQEIADAIKQIKARGIRETPRHAKRVYSLTGILKCSVCGSNYAGDRGIYRCNSRIRAGEKCSNNDVSQRIVEGALFSFISQYLLKFRNIEEVIARIKKRFNNDGYEIKQLQKRLASLDKSQERVMRLVRRGKVPVEVLEKELLELDEHRKAISSKLEKQKLAKLEAGGVDEKAIRGVIENLREEFNHSAPKARKRAVLALFQDIRIHPKNDDKKGRMIEVKGVSLPLTRLYVASPTGFEPVSPA